MKLTLSFISTFSVSFSDLDLVMFNKATSGLMVLPCNIFRHILVPDIEKHPTGWGAVLEIKVTGQSSTQFQVGRNGNKSLPNDSLTLLNAELNDKQPIKCTYLKGLTLQPHNSIHN
jgi:hypothetical protein